MSSSSSNTSSATNTSIMFSLSFLVLSICLCVLCVALLFFPLLSSFSSSSSLSVPPPLPDYFSFSRSDRHCSLVLVGGGVAGLYAATEISRLGLEESVCLVEKDSSLGGRVSDFFFLRDPTVPVAMGAASLNEGHEEVMKLIKRYNISIEPFEFTSIFFESRGIYSSSPDNLLSTAYKTLINNPLFTNITPSSIESIRYNTRWGYSLSVWQYLSSLSRVPGVAASYPNLGSFIRETLGPEGLDYLSAISPLTGDLMEFSIVPYFDWIDAEIALYTASPLNYHPVNGMSELIHELSNEARQLGVRIYLNEPVMDITSFSVPSPGYAIGSLNYRFLSKKLILSCTPTQIHSIAGNVPLSLFLHILCVADE